MSSCWKVFVTAVSRVSPFVTCYHRGRLSLPQDHYAFEVVLPYERWSPPSGSALYSAAIFRVTFTPNRKVAHLPDHSERTHSNQSELTFQTELHTAIFLPNGACCNGQSGWLSGSREYPHFRMCCQSTPQKFPSIGKIRSTGSRGFRWQEYPDDTWSRPPPIPGVSSLWAKTRTHSFPGIPHCLLVLNPVLCALRHCA